MTKVSNVLIKYQRVTKSEQCSKCRTLWSKEKVTKSEQWSKCRKLWSKVRNYKNWTTTKMLQFWSKEKSYKSQQWPKCHKLWSKVKKFQNLKKDRNITYYDIRSKSYKIWTMTEMSQILIKTKSYQSQQWPKCHKFWSKVKKVTKSEKSLLTT